MKKACWFTSFVVALAAIVLVSSCAPAAGTSPPTATASNSSVSNPVIAITYSAAFAGQTAAGYLNLIVDVTIENRGYVSFNTDPADFSVEVNNYSYDAKESDLQIVDLPDGDRISGRLAFHVPAVAATTRVGYQMAYLGQTRYNIQWFEESKPVSTSNNPASSPVVEITYSGAFMWVKDTSSLYLLVETTIENKGYESFNTAPERFSLVVGNIFGQSTPTSPIKYDGELSDERDGAYTDLRAYDLQNGGKITGTLAFKVPKTILASTESYRMEYSGLRAYNIQWTMKPPQQ